jgi:hypothetical protein
MKLVEGKKTKLKAGDIFLLVSSSQLLKVKSRSKLGINCYHILNSKNKVFVIYGQTIVNYDSLMNEVLQ